MERLKVLFITAWYPTKEHPVLGVFVREHAKAVQLYDDVFVLHCAKPDQNLKRLWHMQEETDENLTHGIPTYHVCYQPSKIPKIWYATYLWGVFQAFRAIVAKGFRPDIIHAHVYEAGVPAVLIGKAYRIPVVVTEHSSGFPMGLPRRQDVWKARFAFSNADRVLPVSFVLQKAIESYDVRARFQIVPNAVDLSLFHPCFDYRPDNRPKRLLFVGLLDPSHKKGLPFLFQALERLKEHKADWHLDIVGDGPARQEYESMTEDLGLVDRVTFHGLKTKEEVGKFMRKADIFVLPSPWENLPCVLIEAMASGLPIVSTLTGGIPEMIHEGIGILIPPGDVTKLSRSIAQVIHSIDKFDRRAIAQHALQYSSKSVGRLIHSIYIDHLRK